MRRQTEILHSYTMKTCIIYFLIFFFISSTYAQSVNLNFAFKIGGLYTEHSRAIATGPNDVVAILGSFDSVIDVDPSPNEVTLTPSSNRTDLFVAQYTQSGQYKWAFSLPLKDSPGLFGDITIDGLGNVYLTGSFHGTIDFDPGPGVTNLSAVSDSFDRNCFIAKYDADGNFQWAFSIGSFSAADEGRSLVADNEGNVYVTGMFTGSVDFDPGPIVNQLVSAGQFDIFVAKYNTSGEYQWAFRAGNYLFDRGESIELSKSGNIVVTGIFYVNADFAPGPATINLTSAGLSDIFVAQYTPSGSCLWAFSIGSPDYDDGLSITSDGDGNVYVTGDFTGSADFDPSANQAILTASPNTVSSGFVAKYNSLGTYQWANKIDGKPYSETIGRSINANILGDVAVTGTFNSQTNFDSEDSSTMTLMTLGNRDAFVANYSSEGNLKKVFQIGSSSDDGGQSIIIDESGVIFTTGVFRNTANFDPGTGVTNLTATNVDSYVASYKLTNIPKVCESVKSGQWEDTNTWSCERIPLSTDKVTINRDHVVTINTAEAVARQLTYQGGRLIFGVGSRLRLQNNP